MATKKEMQDEAKQIRKEAENNANAKDPGSMKILFDAVANERYLMLTPKSSEELSPYNSSKDGAGWGGESQDDEEWETVSDCIEHAKTAADGLLSNEENQNDDECC